MAPPCYGAIEGHPGPMHYAMAPPVVHLPSEFVPNDYFIPTLVIAIVCPIVSFSTIIFTVAAIICSILVSLLENSQHYCIIHMDI